MISWAVGSRSSRGLEGLGDQGCVGADDAGDGGLGDAVELGEQLLGQVVPQPGSGSGARTGTAPAPSPRTPAGRDSRRKWSRTGPQPRCGRFSCYYSSWRFASWLDWLKHQRFSQEQAATLLSDTLLPTKHPKHPYEQASMSSNAPSTLLEETGKILKLLAPPGRQWHPTEHVTKTS